MNICRKDSKGKRLSYARSPITSDGVRACKIFVKRTKMNYFRTAAASHTRPSYDAADNGLSQSETFLLTAVHWDAHGVFFLPQWNLGRWDVSRSHTQLRPRPRAFCLAEVKAWSVKIEFFMFNTGTIPLPIPILNKSKMGEKLGEGSIVLLGRGWTTWTTLDEFIRPNPRIV